MLKRFMPEWASVIWAGSIGLGVILVVFASGKQPPAEKTSGQDRPSRPFLEIFLANREPPIITQKVIVQSAVGPVQGLLARPETKERLPAVLVIPSEEGLTEWMKENTRDLSGIGYVVLALDLHPNRSQSPASQDRREILSDEPTLAWLSAAVRWLRRRADVFPDRIGVVGWSWGGGQALALAASVPLQACVICDGNVTDDPAIIAGLRGTPVLGIFAGNERSVQKGLRGFQKALANKQNLCRIKVYEGVSAGFMGPPDQKSNAHEAADKAFVEIYEFLGKYVEDSPENSLKVQTGTGSLAAENSTLSIADIMLAVNAPEGVRGNLMKTMEKEPANQAQWDRVRAYASLIAEAGNLLRSRRPPKGNHSDWMEQTRAYIAAAEVIVELAERRDYTGAQRGLKHLATRCASCHENHR